MPSFAWTPCLPPLICPTLSVSNAGLFTVPFKGKDGFGTPVEIVPAAGSNNYYPSYSPDGRFIVFNRASGESYNAPTARVMVVPAGGGTPVDLAFFMTNVTNESRILFPTQSWNTFGGDGGHVNEPRMWGVRVKYRFGGNN